MLLVKDYAVLVVVDIRGVLQIVFLAVKRYGDYPVILSCRMSKSSCIAFVLRAEEALRVGRALGFSRGGNVPGILLGLA